MGSNASEDNRRVERKTREEANTEASLPNTPLVGPLTTLSTSNATPTRMSRIIPAWVMDDLCDDDRGANSWGRDCVLSRSRSSWLRKRDSAELVMYIPMVGAAGLEPATR